MESHDQQKFKELITLIADTYGKEFSRSKLEGWWRMLKPLSIEQFESAVYSHMTCPDQGMYPPKPASLTRFVSGTTKQNEQEVEDKAELAWQVIEGEIRRIGSYGSLKMEDKQALAAVQALGGWKHLCSLTNDQMVWAHKEFVSTYQNYERTPVEALPDKLPGRVALENHKAEQAQGLKHITDGIQAYRNRKGIENNG